MSSVADRGARATELNPLSEVIRRELQVRGVISFARFMDLALYHLDHGYYQTADKSIGKAGDYFTSVSVGKVLGQLLAFRFAEWLANGNSTGSIIDSLRDSPPASVQLVEAGAHDGQLAADIMNWLRQRRPQLFARIEYWIVEPSIIRQTRQKNFLRDFEPHVRWLPQLPQNSDPNFAGFWGIIFSNELLDALPVHRLGWDAAQRRWFEWGVAWETNRFVWMRMTNSGEDTCDSSFFPEVPSELAAVFPDGFTTEICPSASQWWSVAAQCLRRGKLLTLDYGLTGEEFLSPKRGQGTLRAYFRHVLTADVLAYPGEQDLTAHVNFTELQKTGEAVGLTTDGLTSQSQFLTQIAERAWQPNAQFGEWSAVEQRQFQTLTHPEHLGRNFRVLVQTKK